MEQTNGDNFALNDNTVTAEGEDCGKKAVAILSFLLLRRNFILAGSCPHHFTYYFEKYQWIICDPKKQKINAKFHSFLRGSQRSRQMVQMLFELMFLVLHRGRQTPALLRYYEQK